MKKKLFSQEGLKLIACVSMLLDHIGASIYPNTWLRLIGRLAFPIYCFLLAEGAFYTKNPKKYALRLFIGMLLSELPFDYLFIGSGSPGISLGFLISHGIVWMQQSVMVTLLLAFLMMLAMKRIRPIWGRLLVMLPFAVLAEMLYTDYGFWGVVMAGLFFITREMPKKIWVQTAFVALICLILPSSTLWGIPVQLFGTAAMVPIGLYSGHKLTSSRAAQWGFYLFYPVHLALLCLFY